MNKEDLVRIVADKTGMTQKEAHLLVGTTFDVMTTALSKRDKVTLVGFGTLQVRERAAREGRNPRTGATIQIPARKAPVFVPGKLLRTRVVGKRAAARR